MAREFNVTEDDGVFVGAANDLVVTVYTDDTETTPVDPTGYTLVWRLRKHNSARTVLIEKSSTIGSPVAEIEVAGSPIAVVVIHLLAEDTYGGSPAGQLLQPGTYRHALMRTDAGNESVLAYGVFTLLRATTP